MEGDEGGGEGGWNGGGRFAAGRQVRGGWEDGRGEKARAEEELRGEREGKESGAGGGIMASLLHVAAWLHCSLLQVYPCMFSMFSQSSATAVSIEWDL